MRYVIITCLFLLAILQGASQNNTIDSLRTVLYAAEEDSSKIKAMSDLSSEYLPANLDSAKTILKQF